MIKRGKYASRQAERQRKKSDATTSKRKLVVALIIAIVVGPFIFYFAFFGSEFRPPPIAPVENQTGYYKVTLYDAFNGVYLNSSKITQINASNYAIIRNDIATDTVYYSNTPSYLFVNISGYHPLAIALWASGGNDSASHYKNLLSLQRKINPADLTFMLIRWYNQTGHYWNYSNQLPSKDGTYKLHFSINIDGFSKNTSLFGCQTWVPPTILPPESIAYVKSWTFTANWLGFVCKNITAYRFSYTSGVTTWPYQTPFMIPTMNCTVIPDVWWSMDFYIEATFIGLESIQLFEGLIDNYLQPVAQIIT